MRRIETIELGAGRSIHAVTAGTGADLVLIHGALATSHDWLSGPFDALAAGHRVTAIDRPGHGLSLRPRFEGTPRAQARQIKAGLDALGVERAMLVGHSLGGMVSLAFTELYPEAVSALVLLCPIGFPEPRPLEHSLLAPRAAPVLGPLLSSLGEATFDPPMLRGIQQLMFAPDPVPDHWQQSFPYELVLDPRTMVAEGEDMAAILPGSPAGMINVGAIKVPTHVITGTRDRIVRPETQGQLLATLMPDARLTQIRGAGHMPHHTHASAVEEAVLKVVADSLTH